MYFQHLAGCTLVARGCVGLFSFLLKGTQRTCLLACFDTAEDEPCSKVCPLFACRSPRYVRLMEYVNHVVLPERSKECGREMMHLHLVLLASYGSPSARLMQLCCPVSLRFFQGMMQVGELLYPEIAATIWVWKPPWIASRIYQILSPMMEAHARAVTRAVLVMGIGWLVGIG